MLWLSLAAALAHAKRDVPGPVLPALSEATVLLHQVREMSLGDLEVTSSNVSLRDGPVGRLAAVLRRYMRGGPGAVLLRRDVLSMQANVDR